MTTPLKPLDRTLVLREVRHSLGLTQQQVAFHSGTSLGYYQRVEAGLWPQRHDAPAFTAILEALGLTEDQVRGDEAPARP